ncbi:MAG: cbb3-type cytochrome c oxidase subunit I, partial [Desulforhopalus sp.]
AAPPADFVLHNSLFLIAHFHNVLIPGALFGYFAGYTYWFPKAVGFTLNEKWGRRAFWSWLLGFYLAFMPLYVLGFMGMPRRMSHYDTPAWQPYLILAAAGTVVIVFGVLCQIIQLFISIKERQTNRDLTGDPWDGRTLEWATASPPAVYNFATIPTVHDIDAFTDMKADGSAYRRPDRYHDIHLPRNSPAGLVLGFFAFLLGFAMIWHIWWLAIASGLGILFTIVVRAADDDSSHVIPASEVARIEKERHQLLAVAAGRVGQAAESMPGLSGRSGP